MWYSPEKYNKEVVNVNEESLKLVGSLSDKEAKITLVKFLRNNLSFTVELLTGVKLAPYQEVNLKGLMNRNFSMCVWGRGCGKTFMASIFCILQCIFVPGTRILIAGPTFRTARFIFNNIEKLCEGKGAELLFQAFGVKSKRNDQYEWHINGGSIVAIPLNGEKIRGFRASILVLDEFLLLSEDLIKTVLMPFLVAPQNIKERIEIREIENKLIEKGSLKEEDRLVFENTSKMIALSSASYTFENLYKTHKEWVEKIYSKDVDSSKYFISQMGWDSIPTHMIDQTIIEEAQSGGVSHSSFQREYCAQFTDGSDSYFSAKKMHECTIPDGQEPTTLIRGKPNKKYILSIDPNASDSPSADYFGMAILELDEESRTSTLVHNYAGLGGISCYVKYLHYILNNFNIVFAIVDNAGADIFLGACNESEIFIKSNLNLKTINFNSILENADYQKAIINAKREINVESKKVFFTQTFTSEFIRKANEYLQTCIDHKKIWFASKMTANGGIFDASSSCGLNVEFTGEESVLDLIEVQDLLIYQVKKQCALVEVTSTAKGTQSFDLPQHLKRSNSTNRARKDNYTALLLGNWAARCYYDIMGAKVETESSTFAPIVIRY